jgi:hypothetical protein
MTALLSAWVWLALGPVAVEGNAACPAAADIAARVAALLPAARTTDAPDLVRLDDDAAGALRVTLSRPDGTPLGERALARTFTCDDLAAAVAVVVAAWESDVHPEFQPTPAPAPTIHPEFQPTPAPAPTIAVAPTRPSIARARTRFDVGAAVSGSLAPTSGDAGPALGAILAGSWTPAHGRVGVRLTLATTTLRDLPLASGQVSWRRFEAAIGPQVRLTSAARRWALDLHADARLAWLTATGDGFTNDSSAAGVDPGLGAGVRVLRLQGEVAPWLELSVDGWPRRQQAYATPSGASVTLPRFDLTLALGLSFCACP